MISNIIGNADWPAAAIMIALFVGSGIAFAFYRATPRQTDRQYELEKIRLQNSLQDSMYARETNRLLETKKLEQNLITSHRAE